MSYFDNPQRGLSLQGRGSQGRSLLLLRPHNVRFGITRTEGQWQHGRGRQFCVDERRTTFGPLFLVAESLASRIWSQNLKSREAGGTSVAFHTSTLSSFMSCQANNSSNRFAPDTPSQQNKTCAGGRGSDRSACSDDSGEARRLIIRRVQIPPCANSELIVISANRPRSHCGRLIRSNAERSERSERERLLQRTCRTVRTVRTSLTATVVPPRAPWS
jgi:hypothetical protein